jgi:hypothetical protein
MAPTKGNRLPRLPFYKRVGVLTRGRARISRTRPEREKREVIHRLLEGHTGLGGFVCGVGGPSGGAEVGEQPEETWRHPRDPGRGRPASPWHAACSAASSARTAPLRPSSASGSKVRAPSPPPVQGPAVNFSLPLSVSISGKIAKFMPFHFDSGVEEKTGFA